MVDSLLAGSNTQHRGVAGFLQLTALGITKAVLCLRVSNQLDHVWNAQLMRG
jgi:hypothetical protein